MNDTSSWKIFAMYVVRGKKEKRKKECMINL